MKIRHIILLITLAVSASQAWSQAAQGPFLKLVNKEGVEITQKDAVVSRKFFESSVVTLQSDEGIPRGSDMMVMLGEKALMFDVPTLSPAIKNQILQTPSNTKIVFSIQQKTNKELKLRLVD